MAKVTPISEHFQHFLADLKETFWGDVYGQTRLAWQRFFQLESERQRDRFAGWGWYERGARKRRQYRNGYYERDFVTRFGTLRLRIARTRGKSFLPCGLQRFQRRAEEVSMLIREAFLRGISTRQVGRVVAVLSGMAFLRSQGESQADWEALLQDLYRRGLEGKQLGLIVTDGCPGLAAAIQIVYPRARHQRCWVHKMRNILEKVRKCDHDEAKSGAQAIYLAESRARAEAAFRAFRARWRRQYAAMVRRLERDLPELLSFFAFPRHLWRKLRTTNVIERCFVEVRRRTRPMVCFVNVESVDRIIYSIFQRFNLEWKTRTLSVFTQAA